MRIKVGDKAPYFEEKDVNGVVQTPYSDGKSPVLLTFFRHAGCPMCNLRTRKIILDQDKFKEYDLNALSVFESSIKNIKRDVGKQNPPFPIIPDRERKLYKLYGVTISWIGFVKIFFANPKHVFEAIFKNGFIPKFGEATPMMPADFLLAPDGRVLLAYYGTDIGDHAPLQDVYDKLDEYYMTRDEIGLVANG